MIDTVIDTLVRVLAILICITFHELAHGYTAYRLGDTTAQSQGRLSLNPIAHIDIIGLICMFVAGIGWAKPVPVNPYLFRMKNKRLGMAITAAAGPLANFIMSFVCLLIVVPVLAYGKGSFAEAGSNILWTIALMGLGLGVFNLIPIPPLDGSKILGLFMPLSVIRWIDRNEGYIRFGFLLLVFFGGFSSTISSGMNFLLDKMWSAVIGIYGLVGLI